MPEDRPSQQEWELLQNTLSRGRLVKGRVTTVAPFGVFVDIGLDPRIPVLLEIIHFKVREDEPGHRIRFPEDYPKLETRSKHASWPTR